MHTHNSRECAYSMSNYWQTVGGKDSTLGSYCTNTHVRQGCTRRRKRSQYEELTGGVEDARWGWGEALSEQSVVRRSTGASLQHRVCQKVVTHGPCKTQRLKHEHNQKHGHKFSSIICKREHGNKHQVHSEVHKAITSGIINIFTVYSDGVIFVLLLFLYGVISQCSPQYLRLLIVTFEQKYNCSIAILLLFLFLLWLLTM